MRFYVSKHRWQIGVVVNTFDCCTDVLSSKSCGGAVKGSIHFLLLHDKCPVGQEITDIK